ncbi:MAG TPA: biofilm-associated protein, partial [Nitrosopumilus sp.]|nr:biofilm-associated protein [Nitrosopumilus sp.]
GAGTITINATKSVYLAGDSMVLLGDATKNSILVISLMDPDGNIIRDKNTFSDKNGRISDNSFKIPTDAKQGTWKIIVRSGSTSDSVEFEVLSTIEEGMTLSILEGLEIDSEIKTITINVSGAQQNVTVKILTDNGEMIDSFTSLASDQGNISLPWSIPSNVESGEYTVIVTDAFNTTQITFEII